MKKLRKSVGFKAQYIVILINRLQVTDQSWHESVIERKLRIVKEIVPEVPQEVLGNSARSKQED